MENKSVLYELEQSVARITLNRPDVLNSFNRPMAKALQAILKEIAEDPDVRALLLTGSGRAFCAGQDLVEALPSGEDLPTDIGEIVEQSYNPIIRGICNLERPVVCAVNGVAAGAGANIALACDIVLASSKASFIQSFCNIGLVPDSGGTFHLPRLVGLPMAKAMMMLGERISAEKALEIGMIFQVCEPDALMEEAGNLARHLAARPTRALGLTKRAINMSCTNDLDAQLELERELQGQAGKTRDYQEGVKAFLEKRKPDFKGN